MLQAMRDRVMGWLGWIIIGLIIVTFALFGLGSYLQDKTRIYVAKVGDVEIPPAALQNAYQQQRAQLEARLGENYDPALFDEERLKASALNSLVRRQLVLQAANEAGVGISDQLLAAHIQSIPGLQENGRFSEERYKTLLFQQGRNTAGFEAETREMLQVEQMVYGLTGTDFVTGGELERAYRLQEQRRDFSYLVIPAAPLESTAELDADLVQQYYETHPEEFMVPERVRLSYLQLSGDALREEVEVEEDEIQSYYAENRASMLQTEQRRASHILIQIAADADEEAVKEAQTKAQHLLDQIHGGADLAALARENSDDPGSAAQGGDLGFFTRGAMVPEFDEAVFSQETGAVSGLVRTQFGFHIIQVTDVKAGEVPALEDVRDRLVAELKQGRVDDLFYDQLEQLTDMSYEHPDSLDAAAEALGLEVQTSAWLTVEGGEGIGQYKKLMAVAFSEDVLEGGNNSEPIEVGEHTAIVVRVAERDASRPSALEEVRSSIEMTLRKQQAVDAARAEGEAILESLKQGDTLEQLDDQDKPALRKAENVHRAEAGHDPQVVREAFKLARPQEGQSIDTGFALPSGDFVVMRLTGVRDGDPASMSEEDRTALTRAFDNMHSSTALFVLIESLQGRADIEYPEQAE